MKYSLNRTVMFAALMGTIYQQAAGEDVSAGATASAAPVVQTPEQVAAAEKAAAEAAAVATEKRHAEIKANFNNLVDVADTAFHFRKVVNEVKNPDTGEVAKIETKRPTVTIPVPAPSVEGLIDIITQGGKGLDLLLEAVRDKVLEQARETINDTADITEANFPYNTLAWDFIANLPKAERRGGGIPKELWDEFQADYIQIMPGLTGKPAANVELAAKLFVSKFANAKTNKPVLRVLQDQLTIYTNNTTKGETLAQPIEWLSSKLDTLIKTDETNLLNAL